jgi:hypothetical protein
LFIRRYSLFCTDSTAAWIRHHEAFLNLYTHEVAIHFDHDVDDFRPPPMMTDDIPVNLEDSLTPAHINALTGCIESFRSMYDAFFDMDVHTIQNLPNFYIVRNSYAAAALIKIAGMRRRNGATFEAIMTPTLDVESYLDKMIAILGKAANGNQLSIAHSFTYVLGRFKKWHIWRQHPGNEPGGAMRSIEQRLPFSRIMQEAKRQRHPSAIDENTPSAVGGSIGVHDTNTVRPDAAADPMSAEYSAYLPSFNGINDIPMFNFGFPAMYDFSLSHLGMMDHIPP